MAKPIAMTMMDKMTPMLNSPVSVPNRSVNMILIYLFE
jgi:hypothetical protein